MARNLLMVAMLSVAGPMAAAQSEPFAARTRVGLDAGRWTINGQRTYRGAAAEGLLMNVRFVNVTFEDRHRPEFAADANTDTFLKALPEYVAHGVRGITLCLQGGQIGYEGALNSAFEPDGSLRDTYLLRVQRVIEACDRLGVVVLLGCYYQRQDQVLRDEAALRSGVEHVAQWLARRGYTNVVLEIANEFPHRGFNHTLLRSPEGQAELIRLARATHPQLLVSSSGVGDGRLPDAVAEAADFLLIHFNGTPVGEIPDRVAALRRFGKPIVCNEDDKTGPEAVRAAEQSVSAGISWGYMNKEVNQFVPLVYDGAKDDPELYGALLRLTTPRVSGTPGARPGERPAEAYFPPPDAEGGWRTVDPGADLRRVAGMERADLDRAFEYIQGSSQHGGLLVVRDGWLAYERYFGLGHRDATPNLASCGKSVTSIAVGMLLAEQPEKFPDGLAQRVYTPEYLPPDAFPLTDPRKAEIQLGQLLTMTAGIRGNNPGLVHGRPVTLTPAGPDGALAMEDDVAFGHREEEYQGSLVSAQTLWCAPGGGYSYATSSIHIASAMLRHVSGQELEDYVRAHLAGPLGWGTWGYAYRTPHRMPHTPGGGGIALRATDMLRFGYLLLMDGRWQDRQLVPRDYVRHCGTASPFNPHTGYSLQFHVNARGDVASLPRDAYWKQGSGGHVLYVVPSERLVVWKLAGRTSQYAPSNTGLPPSPASSAQVAAREDWKMSVDADTAALTTLELVLKSLRDK